MIHDVLTHATSTAPADAGDRVTAKVIPLKVLKHPVHRPAVRAAALGTALQILSARATARPKERATPGVPGLKQVESLTDPHAWSWVFRYTDPVTGKRGANTYGSSTSVSYMEAVARAQRDRELVRRGLSPKGSAISVNDFVETVVTPWARENLRSCKDLISRYRLYFAASLGAMRVQDVSRLAIAQTLDDLRKPGKSRRRARLSAATVNRGAMALRTIFRLATQRGLIDRNPLDGWTPLRENPPPPSALTIEELHRVRRRLQSEPERIQLLIDFLLETALRIGEALKARFSDVDVRHRLLNLPETKSGFTQTVPLTPHALRIIARLRELGRNDLLFPAATGNGPMSPPRRVLKRVFVEAGIEPSAGFHLLRKTTATLAADKGIDLLTVSRLLRHRSIRTTEHHYVATRQDSLHRAVNVVSELIHGTANGRPTGRLQ